MIMPCMNSTSACDRGGSVAFVDAGNLLLGLPGAPGCITTGFSGSLACAHVIDEQKRVTAQKQLTAAACDLPPLIAAPLASRNRASLRKRQSPTSRHCQTSSVLT